MSRDVDIYITIQNITGHIRGMMHVILLKNTCNKWFLDISLTEKNESKFDVYEWWELKNTLIIFRFIFFFKSIKSRFILRWNVMRSVHMCTKTCFFVLSCFESFFIYNLCLTQAFFFALFSLTKVFLLLFAFYVILWFTKCWTHWQNTENVFRLVSCIIYNRKSQVNKKKYGKIFLFIEMQFVTAIWSRSLSCREINKQMRYRICIFHTMC